MARETIAKHAKRLPAKAKVAAHLIVRCSDGDDTRVAGPTVERDGLLLGFGSADHGIFEIIQLGRRCQNDRAGRRRLDHAAGWITIPPRGGSVLGRR